MICVIDFFCFFVLFTYELKISLENIGVCDLDPFRLSPDFVNCPILSYYFYIPEQKYLFTTKVQMFKKCLKYTHTHILYILYICIYIIQTHQIFMTVYSCTSTLIKTYTIK